MADALALRGARVLRPTGWEEDCDVQVADGRIAAVGPGVATGDDTAVDVRGHMVVPGFFDLHVHGAGGAMFEDGSADAVERISSALARNGTTALLATLAALPPDQLRTAVTTIARAAPRCSGARVAGVHLEGPFLNPACAGAQRAAWMRAPSVEEFDALQAGSGGLIRLVTVAPELPGAPAFIRALRARGVVIALGHSQASEDEVLAAVAAGATHVTHLFNAAAPLHHRAPGLVGTALTDDRLSVELICDGVHVHRRAVDIALRCKPPDKVILVSDGVAAVGMPPGDVELFGGPCVAGDAVRVRATGQLAGSNATLDRTLRLLHEWFPDRPLERWIDWATVAPRRLLGLAGPGIAPGAPADMVVLTQELAVITTICAGRLLEGGAPSPPGQAGR